MQKWFFPTLWGILSYTLCAFPLHLSLETINSEHLSSWSNKSTLHVVEISSFMTLDFIVLFLTTSFPSPLSLYSNSLLGYQLHEVKCPNSNSLAVRAEFGSAVEILNELSYTLCWYSLLWSLSCNCFQSSSFVKVREVLMKYLDCSNSWKLGYLKGFLLRNLEIKTY